MDNDSVTRDIFNALDTDKKGFVVKQHFINQMTEYLSQTEVSCTDYALNKLNLVNKYPDMIDYENFKRFYEDLMESKKFSKYSNTFSLSDEEGLIDNESDSDIYESELGPCMDINSSRSTLHGSVINLIDFPLKKNLFSANSIERRRSIASYVPVQETQIKRRCDYSSPRGSLRRRGFENFSARSSAFATGCTLSNQEDGKHLNNDDFDEVSCMTDSGVSVATEEVDKLFNNYKTVVGELTELKQKLEDSNNRYQKQRDITRLHNDRLFINLSEI